MTSTISPMRSGPHRRRTVAALVLAGALGLTTACGGETATDPAASDDSAASPSAPAAAHVAAYWIGKTPQGPRLFREDAALAAAPTSPAAAAAKALEGKPADADYRTAVPAGAIKDVTYDSRAGFTVILADDTLTKPVAGIDAKLAVQQLVYTLNAAQGVTGEPVTATIDGKPVKLYGIDPGKGIKPAAELSTLAMANVLLPAEGAKVSGNVAASGLASSFEATVPWSVTDSSGKVVLKGSATAAGWEGHLYPWKAAVDLSSLKPGTYTFSAATDDPSDGEGPGPTVDTKTIIIG